MKVRPQLHGLTVARGLAAWMVVLFHIRSGMPWLPQSFVVVAAKGYLAVDFFFLLSGFVIYLSAHGIFERHGLAALPDLLRRRVARIYPLYAAMLALTVGFAALLTLTGRNADGYPWRELPLHIVLLQNWSFTDELSWNHPAWSISTELAAYLLFPLIMVATPIRRLSSPKLVIGIVLLLATMAAWLRIAGPTELGQQIPRFGIVRCLFEFSAGCLLCALWLRTGKNWLRFAAPSAVIVAAAALWASDSAHELWAFPAMAASLIFVIADLSAWQRPPAPSVRALIYLGELSYATYLSHFMLFIWFKIAMVNDATDIPPMLIALYCMATLAASVLLHHLVEKPGRRWVSGRRASLPAHA